MPAVLRLRISILALSTLGCGGYSDTSLDSLAGDAQVVAKDDPAKDDRPKDDPPVPADAAVEPTHELDDVDAEVSGEPTVQAPDEMVEYDDPLANVRMARNEQFDGYLTDAQGRPLYMFADDVAAAGASACLGACADEWPPFDVTEAIVGRGIVPNEIQRFHRQDGLWQISFKGHPLYYRATEQGLATVTGDGALRRWFVARDYLAFFSREALFGGGDPASELYLTDGFGRTLYICLDDVPGQPGTAPISSCEGDCLKQRPPWYTTSTLRTTILPSTLELSAFTGFSRSDGAAQLTLRGWPLYYFKGDAQLGATAGHNQRAWRAVDPQTFGLDR